MTAEVAPGITLRQWSEAEFAAAATAWTALLERSTAHPLFMSWEWQWHWWQQRSQRGGADLRMLAGYGADGQLVGLAPFYRHRAPHGPVRAARVESMGSEFRQSAEVFSEWFDTIAAPEYAPVFANAVVDALRAQRDWSDLVVANTAADSAIAHALVGAGWYRRFTDPLQSYRTALTDGLDAWLQSLDADVRRKLWNQRAKLEQPRFLLYGDDEIETALDALDGLLAVRWGQPHYRGARREFHVQVARAFARRGALRMSRLENAGATLSIMYDVVLGGIEYNLQSAFDAQLARGLSPAYLHFGYGIERACADGIAAFDFLAGGGRQRDYKRDFNTRAQELITVQTIRVAPLAWIYRLNEWRQRLTR